MKVKLIVDENSSSVSMVSVSGDEPDYSKMSIKRLENKTLSVNKKILKHTNLLKHYQNMQKEILKAIGVKKKALVKKNQKDQKRRTSGPIKVKKK